MFGERVEAFALERRHETARHPQRAEDGIVQPDAEDAAELEIEEGKIERRVVRHHHRVAQKIAKRGQHLLDPRRLAHHLVADRGQAGNESAESRDAA